MLSSLVKEHQARQAARRDTQEVRGVIVLVLGGRMMLVLVLLILEMTMWPLYR